MKVLATLAAFCLAAFSLCQTRSVVRYGGLFGVSGAKGFTAVVGAKIEEIDLGTKRFANPEVWAVGAINPGNGAGGFDACLAEPWYITPKLTFYPLGALRFGPTGHTSLGLGLSVQFNVIRF